MKSRLERRLIRQDAATSLEDLLALRGNLLQLGSERTDRCGNHPLPLRAADTAARLGRYFGTSAQYWLNIQNRLDLDSIDKAVVERDVIPRKAA